MKIKVYRSVTGKWIGRCSAADVVEHFKTGTEALAWANEHANECCPRITVR